MLDLRLVEADRYLASKEAAKKPNRGLRFNKLVPPGPTERPAGWPALARGRRLLHNGPVSLKFSGS
jgi:hypothetical protein